jgi:hypothetical protein
LVHQRISVFRQRSCVYDYLVVVSHLLQEVLSSWAFLDINVADAAIYIYGDGVVGIGDLLELTMDEGLIEIQDESLPTFQVLGLWTKQASALLSVFITPLKHEVLASWVILPIRRWPLLITLRRSHAVCCSLLIPGAVILLFISQPLGVLASHSWC